jgi:predicted PhzF superfamily epimerase YddE/YHI9
LNYSVPPHLKDRSLSSLPAQAQKLAAAGFVYISRVFAASMGIVEDVATGAAHCMITPRIDVTSC